MGTGSVTRISPDNITLRPYHPDDATWLVEAHRAHYSDVDGFDDTFAPLVASILDDFAQSHDSTRERGWIAQTESTRLGSIFCVGLDEETAKLRLFFVTQDARGLGLGQRLLTKCLEFARSSGYKRLQLWTHESHRAACALYQKSGFTCISSKPVHNFGQDLIEQSWQITL